MVNAMRKTVCVVLCWGLGGLCLATEYKDVDPTLQKALGHSGLKSAHRQGGVLRVALDKPEITELGYLTYVYHDICAHQWRQPAVFAQWKLERVEVFNASASQGYVFDARGTVCAEMGQMGKNYRSFIQQRTKACTAGNCPPL